MGVDQEYKVHKGYGSYPNFQFFKTYSSMENAQEVKIR